MIPSAIVGKGVTADYASNEAFVAELLLFFEVTNAFWGGWLSSF